MLRSIQIFTLFAFLFSATLTQAQSTQIGKLSFSAGIGIVPSYIADDAVVNTPPVNARLTYQFTQNFSLSGFVGYSSATTNSPYIISDGQQTLLSNKQTLVGLRGEMRKEISQKFDVYGGGMVGFNHSNLREFDKNTGETISREVDGPTPFDPNASNNNFLYSGFVGSTFYFTKDIGVFAEVGYGVSLLNTGVTIRI